MLKTVSVFLALLTLQCFGNAKEFKSRDKIFEDFKAIFGDDPAHYFPKLRARVEKNESGEQIGIFPMVKDAKEEEFKTCRANLAKLKKSYREARAKGFAEKELPNKVTYYSKMANLRDELVDALGKCGECTSRVQKVDKTKYESKVSCFRPNKDQKVLDGGYDRAKKFVTNVLNFEKQKGGFNYLIRFRELTKDHKLLVDPKANLLTPNSDIPLTATLTVEGLGRFGIYYVIDNFFTERNPDKGAKETIVQFTRNADSKYKQVEAVKSFPENKNMVLMALDDVSGYWYIDDSGYIEYDTVGEFGPLLIGGLTPKTALRVAIDTGWHLLDAIMFPESDPEPGT